jgi:hypothetical protein
MRREKDGLQLMEEYLFLMVLAGEILPGIKTNIDTEPLQCNTIIF